MKELFSNISQADEYLFKNDINDVAIFLPTTGFYPKGTVVKKIVPGYYPKNNDSNLDDCELGLILTGIATKIVCIQVEDEDLLSQDVISILSECETLNSIETFKEFPEKDILFSRSYFFKTSVGANVGNFFVDDSCTDSSGLRVIYGKPVKFLGSFHPPKEEKKLFTSNIGRIKDLPKLLRYTLRPIDAVEDFIFSPVSKVKLGNINGCSNRSILKPGRNICFCKNLHVRESKYSYTMSVCRKGEGKIFLFCVNEECKYPLREIADEINLALEQDDLPVY